MYYLPILFLFSILNSVSARSGEVVMQEPQSADQIDNVRFLVQTYTDMGKTIIYKNRTAWDSMSTEKYEEYDAVIIAHTEQRCPSHDPDTYYDPFSNYENWGPAVRNGNSIILGSNNIKPYYFTDPVDKVMIHGAALFSVSNGVKTGAYISFGRIYRECTELGSTWLNFAFGIEETQEDRFEILWNLGNAKIWNRINAALPTIHPALKNITSDTFDESRFGEAQTLFANNPSEFTAYAHSWPNNYYPFILFKESWTSSPTHSPTSFPSIDKLTPYYARDAFYARDVIDFNWPTRSPTPVQDPCKNNATFFANANETKTCDWIANLGQRNKEKFCSKWNIKKQCPESCDLCNKSSPTTAPSARPTELPTQWMPTKSPTGIPTRMSSQKASERPTDYPSTKRRTESPTQLPSHDLSKNPSYSPSTRPTQVPSQKVSKRPTDYPTARPTESPTQLPTKGPSKKPSYSPTTRCTQVPSQKPSERPTKSPTLWPTYSPTQLPTDEPSKTPSYSPFTKPTQVPSQKASERPTKSPAVWPTDSPSQLPTDGPSTASSYSPSTKPTQVSSQKTSKRPTEYPSKRPTLFPTKSPTQVASNKPTKLLIVFPTKGPTQKIGKRVKKAKHHSENGRRASKPQKKRGDKRHGKKRKKENKE